LKIQEKYKNNPEKQQAELQKLYADKKINPFGGCLLLLIQFPIILAMFYSVAKPITYMFPEELKNQSVIEELENYSAKEDLYKEVYYIEEKRPDLMNTKFLGLNLAHVPSSNSQDITMWIIPILSAVTTFFTSRVTMKQNSANAKNGQNEATEQAMAMQKNMTLFMPIMTGFIAFAVPLGMGLYWLTNNIVSMIVQLWVNKIVNKEENVIKI
jgi:YidC/Oxa1 family membrane protein insertase